MLLMLQECLYTGVQEVGGASSEHAPEGSQVDVVEKRSAYPAE